MEVLVVVEEGGGLRWVVVVEIDVYAEGCGEEWGGGWRLGVAHRPEYGGVDKHIGDRVFAGLIEERGKGQMVDDETFGEEGDIGGEDVVTADIVEGFAGDEEIIDGLRYVA